MLHALNFSIPDDSFLLSGINSTTLMGDLKLQNPIKNQGINNKIKWTH
jgi:hypothetical protein